MFTIFTLPKAFDGIYAIIQENAIQSWTRMVPRPEIILFGDEKGTGDIARKYDLRQEKHVATAASGRPFVNHLFQQASRIAKNDRLCFVNADIIIEPSLSRIVPKIVAGHPKSLLVAFRWDLDVTARIDFSDEQWPAKMNERAAKAGKLHPATGTDLFIFDRHMFDEMPAFVIGRTCYDNWMIWHAKRMRIPVIDVSNCVTLIHQNHEVAVADKGNRSTQAEAFNNLKLLGGYGRCFDLNDADYVVDAEGNLLRKKRPVGYILVRGKRVVQLFRDFFRFGLFG